MVDAGIYNASGIASMNDDLKIVPHAQILFWTLINTQLLRLPFNQVF